MSKIPNSFKQELIEYCKLNNIDDVDGFYLKIMKKGFNIEKYGLLDNPVIEKTVEPKIEYVEVIKEVFLDKIIEKDNKKQLELEKTIQQLRTELLDKTKKITDLEQVIEEFKKFKNTPAIYLNGSNLLK